MVSFNGLELYPQFVNWKLAPGRKQGKPDKLPINAAGDAVSAHDPANWQSLAAASRHNLPIAFSISANDPFCFIDIDNAYDPATGIWQPHALELFQLFSGAFMEFSQSGTGAHIIFTVQPGVVPEKHRCKNLQLGVEFYTDQRFCALTGNQAQGNAMSDFSHQMPYFLERFGFTPPPPVDPGLAVAPGAVDPRYTGEWNDQQLIEAMCGSVGGGGAMFGGRPHPKDLWNADEAVLAKAYPASKREDKCTFDRSSADMALLSHLAFWTGRDGARMERLFRQSALMRDKWNDRPEWVRDTVVKTVNACTKVYDRPRQGALAQANVVSELTRPELMSWPDQQQHFAGCVYVRDRHSVFIPSGDLLKPEQFRVMFGGYEFPITHGELAQRNIKTDAFEVFTQTRCGTFPKVDDVTFNPQRMPGEIIGNKVNIWVPPAIDEEYGDVAPFLRHIALMLPDRRDQAVLLTYLQSLVRYPGIKFQWCPVLQGAPGNGKSLIMRCMYYAIGQRYAYLPKASLIAEKFNDWLIGKVFIGVEEIRISERREALDILKDAVTNERIEIRFPGGNRAMADNLSNWMFLTNHQDAVPIDRSERRYSIFYANQQTVDDIERDGMGGAYFADLYRWLKDDRGYARVSHWLRHAPLVDPSFDPATVAMRAPDTSSRSEALETSYGPFERMIIDAVEAGVPGFRNGWISSVALERLTQQHGIRIGAWPKQQALMNLGYEKTVRSSRRIYQDDQKKPWLWRLKSAPQITNDITTQYIIDQGWPMT